MVCSSSTKDNNLAGREDPEAVPVINLNLDASWHGMGRLEHTTIHGLAERGGTLPGRLQPMVQPEGNQPLCTGGQVQLHAMPCASAGRRIAVSE